MGLCIASKTKDAPVLYGGYGMLLRIRQQTALGFDAELGKAYCADHFTEEEDGRWAEKLNIILKAPRFQDADVPLLNFLFASDESGKADWKVCGRILECLKGHEPSSVKLQYGANGTTSEEDWKLLNDLLEACVKKHASLSWE